MALVDILNVPFTKILWSALILTHILQVCSTSDQLAVCLLFFFLVKFYHIFLLCLHNHFFPGMFSWFPIFFPLKAPMKLKEGDKLELHFWRLNNSKEVWYVYINYFSTVQFTFHIWTHLPNNCLHFTGTNGVSQIQSRFQFTILMEDHIQLAYNELFSEDKNKLEFEIPTYFISFRNLNFYFKKTNQPALWAKNWKISAVNVAR